MIEPALFKQGMRRLASGVSLVTTIRDGVPHGFLATSVSSVSAAPDPCLLVCVNRSASAHDPIQASGIFCINLLGVEEQAWAEGFGDRPRERRFHDRDWTSLATGAPALPGAVASFDCQVAKVVEVNSHTLFIGHVVALALAERAGEPLLYCDGRFRSLDRPEYKPASRRHETA
ncbi:MAG: flavin reductase [Parafilimonas terrae]|nr:flavin reductase [Parafilimonas terrae]